MKSNYEATCNTKLTKQPKNKTLCTILCTWLWRSIVNIHGFMEISYLPVIWLKANTSVWVSMLIGKRKNAIMFTITTFPRQLQMNKALWETCLLRTLACKLTKDQFNNEISINRWRKHTLLSSFVNVMPASV